MHMPMCTCMSAGRSRTAHTRHAPVQLDQRRVQTKRGEDGDDQERGDWRKRADPSEQELSTW